MAESFAEKLLRAHLNQLKRHVQKNGVKGLDRLYKEARADLYDRLHRAGASSDKATPTQLRAMIAQLEATMEALGGRIHRHLQNTASAAAELGAKHGADEYKRLATHFKGTTPVLALDRAAIFRGLVSDVNSSLLSRYRLVTRTWTASAISNIERALSVGTLAGKSWHQLTNDLMGTAGIMNDERWKMERIVRTESQYGHGAAKFAAMKQTQEDVGPLWKRLIETFDDRTGDDSFVLHGQTVPLDKPFVYRHRRGGVWVKTEYMHPPNRPNDRAVVIPWDPEWEETAAERPLTRAELAAVRTTRWRKTVGVVVPPGHTPWPHGRPKRKEGR